MDKPSCKNNLYHLPFKTHNFQSVWKELTKACFQFMPYKGGFFKQIWQAAFQYRPAAPLWGGIMIPREAQAEKVRN